jgi:hypothetical protein
MDKKPKRAAPNADDKNQTGTNVYLVGTIFNRMTPVDKMATFRQMQSDMIQYTYKYMITWIQDCIHHTSSHITIYACSRMDAMRNLCDMWVGADECQEPFLCAIMDQYVINGIKRLTPEHLYDLIYKRGAHGGNIYPVPVEWQTVSHSPYNNFKKISSIEPLASEQERLGDAHTIGVFKDIVDDLLRERLAILPVSYVV